MSDIEKIRQEIERRMLELARDKYIDLHDTLCRTKELNLLLAFIDSLPEETCKDSLHVSESCQENTDSFTDEPKELEKAAGRGGFDYVDNIVQETPEHRWNDHDVEFGYRDGFIAGAKWMESQMPMPEDTVIFMKGVAEGRRLEKEDRNDDKLPRYYGD